MNSKERVHRALQRKPVDRVPIYMWYHPETFQKLTHTLEIPPDAFDLVMCNDVKQRWVGNNYAMEGITHEKDGEGHIDNWGIEWVRQGGSIKFIKVHWKMHQTKKSGITNFHQGRLNNF